MDPDGYVLSPVSPNGLNPHEITVAEVLKDRGYATAIIGKWHLGDQLPFLPTRQGFDYYLGIPYSEDQIGGRKLRGRQGVSPPLPLIENEEVVEAPADRNLLTKRYTEKCIDLVRRYRDRPFFIYLPYATPGSAASSFASERFRGKSANGLYGDAVEEVDWSAGQILAALQQFRLDDQTLVIWTSDNGAIRRDPPQGSNGQLRGWLGTTAEGAQRVPCIVRWPGKIPAGDISDAVATMMDFLPTFAGVAGTQPPRDRIIDGKDIYPLMTGQSKKSPHEAFYYYLGPQLQAVRSGKWKLFLPLEKPLVSWDRQTTQGTLALYDLDEDPGEIADLAVQHPSVVRQLLSLAEKARQDLGDVDRPGENQRPAGRFANPQPRLLSTRACRNTVVPARA